MVPFRHSLQIIFPFQLFREFTELLRRGDYIDEIANSTKIDRFFLRKIRNITDAEKKLKNEVFNAKALYSAKRMGFSDKEIAALWDISEQRVYETRTLCGIFPIYKMIDTCASEFESYVPYFYSTYEEEEESVVSDKKKIIVLGSGPIRIGQGVEFDYSTVHAVKTIKEAGYEAIIINNNPETVSTDYTTSDKLYFEPLCVEDVMNIIHHENPIGVIASLGGQTAINLAQPLAERGVKIIGTDCDAIEKAENRKAFEKLLHELDIPQPKGMAVTNIEAGVRAAEEIGYPQLELPDVHGKKVKISDLDAKAVLLYFWSPDNALQKMANLDVLKKIYSDYKGKGLEIYQVAIAVDKPAWERIVTAQGLGWTNVCDGLGENSPVIGQYNLNRLPAYFLIVDGQLSDRAISDEKTLRKALDQVL